MKSQASCFSFSASEKLQHGFSMISWVKPLDDPNVTILQLELILKQNLMYSKFGPEMQVIAQGFMLIGLLILLCLFFAAARGFLSR